MLAMNGRRFVPLHVLACVGLMATFTAACNAPTSLTAQCSWLDAEKKAIESVPLQEFTDTPLGPMKAFCSTSAPDVLYVEIWVRGGLDLPADWLTRDSVGEWSVARRWPSEPNGAVLCYTSSRAEWTTVQVQLSAEALTAEIHRGQAPCSDGSA